MNAGIDPVEEAPPVKRRRSRGVQFLPIGERLSDTESLIKEPFHLKTLNFSIDSGAHSLYKKIFSGDGTKSAQARIHADYSYTETAEFKSFLDYYIQILLNYREFFDFYVTLDIIGNAEKSWEVTEYIESYGLTPMPVYHFGEPISWLKRMANKYEYIGVGGMGQDITKTRFRSFAHDAFKILCDKDGRPRHKIHGFALGTPDFVTKYPFFTCDSSTWTYMARVGSILIPPPKIINGRQIGYDFLSNAAVVASTLDRIHHKAHFDNMPPGKKEYIMRYLGLYGITDFDQVRESYIDRDILNIYWFKQMERAAKSLYARRWGYEEGANILFAGTSSHASTDLVKFIELLYETGLDNFHFLCTPEYKKGVSNAITLKQCHINDIDLRLAQVPFRKNKKVPRIRQPDKTFKLLGTYSRNIASGTKKRAKTIPNIQTYQDKVVLKTPTKHLPKLEIKSTLSSEELKDKVLTILEDTFGLGNVSFDETVSNKPATDDDPLVNS